MSKKALWCTLASVFIFSVFGISGCGNQSSTQTPEQPVVPSDTTGEVSSEDTTTEVIDATPTPVPPVTCEETATRTDVHSLNRLKELATAASISVEETSDGLLLTWEDPQPLVGVEIRMYLGNGAVAGTCPSAAIGRYEIRAAEWKPDTLGKEGTKEDILFLLNRLRVLAESGGLPVALGDQALRGEVADIWSRQSLEAEKLERPGARFDVTLMTEEGFRVSMELEGSYPFLLIERTR